MKWLLLGMFLAQGADVATTWVGLKRGCEERVWPTQNPYVIAGVKGGASVALTLTLPKGPKWLRIAAPSALIASGTYGTVHNLRALKSCGK